MIYPTTMTPDVNQLWFETPSGQVDQCCVGWIHSRSTNDFHSLWICKDGVCIGLVWLQRGKYILGICP